MMNEMFIVMVWIISIIFFLFVGYIIGVNENGKNKV